MCVASISMSLTILLSNCSSTTLVIVVALGKDATKLAHFAVKRF